MTFSSASVSACEVDEVDATAAVGGGLRAVAGGKAACWRVAGAMAAAAAAGAATGTVLLAAGLAEVLLAEILLADVLLAEVLGTTLRAIGRGLGIGTFGLAQASAANADNPTASARLVANAVDRNAAARREGVTAFLRGESFNG
jgi:hypothetical protein